MPHDTNGREYLRVGEAKAGLTVELDGGFDCHAPGKVELKDCFTGPYFECSHGSHNIDSQLSHDGKYYVGVYNAE